MRETDFRDGEVTQVAPLLVKVGSSDVGTPSARNAGYQPAVGDRVKVMVQGGDRCVMFKVVGQ